jgi:hypothetical protein
MKTLVACLFLITFYTSISAQSKSITIEASQNITNFSFTNSNGELDKNYKPIYSGGYAIGYRFENEKGLLLAGKIGMRKAGASYIFDSYNYTWDLSYSEARLGIGYNYKMDKIGIHILGQPYFGYLLKGEQVLNNENFDILNTGYINKIDYGVILSPGVNFNLASDMIKIYIDLNYLYGLNNLETNEEQKSRNTMFGGTIGLAINLTK